MLRKLLDESDDGVSSAIVVVHTAKNAEQKKNLLAKLRAERKEGIVFKRHDAESKPGRPAEGGDQVKFKFWATTSCVVADKATGKARSVWLRLLDTNKQTWVEIGKCTIPVNFDVPKPGTIVEIRYLYCYKGGSLYQPIYQGPRDDIDEDACVMTQLKYKAEGEDEA
jgi:bifunctional non-homologous end joining protein LigD